MPWPGCIVASQYHVPCRTPTLALHMRQPRSVVSTKPSLLIEAYGLRSVVLSVHRLASSWLYASSFRIGDARQGVYLKPYRLYGWSAACVDVCWNVVTTDGVGEAVGDGEDTGVLTAGASTFWGLSFVIGLWTTGGALALDCRSALC